ncbi:hypothetical protein [Modestobacter sp. SYSU DS0657]
MSSEQVTVRPAEPADHPAVRALYARLGYAEEQVTLTRLLP